MKTSLFRSVTMLLALQLSQAVLANPEGDVSASDKFKQNGVTYMSMQSDNTSWMDTVWLLEVEETSENLFDVVVSPTPKRISIKALTAFASNDWIEMWNRKLTAADLNNSLRHGEYTKAFSQVMQYLPKQLMPDDVFSIESDGADTIQLMLNDDLLASIQAPNQFSFWLSVWVSASHAGIYADGSMLAKGQIEPYLAKLFTESVPPSVFFSASL